MSDIIRAFLSIEIEDQALLSQIQKIQQRLDKSSAKMKIVEISNVHFTLRFFGDTPMARLDEIKKCLNEVSFKPFEVEIAGVGSFPNKRRPRIVWIGVTKNESEVLKLKNEIDNSLVNISYKPEKRKYTPHATIARIRHVTDSKGIADNLESLAEEEIGKMTISHVTMMKSTLTSAGPIYESLWSIGNNA
ncbi:MAG: RNA 2',3'-cyclic phosphodiesterase [Candidatus Thorarchaeota archaeon]